MTSPPFYMPTRFDSAAPRFDEHDATTLLPFFDDLEILFACASISDDQEKKLHARRYAPDRSYDLFAAIQQFASPATFSEFREAILDLWPGSRNRDRIRRADLEELLAKRRSIAIATEDELAEFYRNYLAISEQLIASQRLCVLEQCRAFATAFDAPLWSAIAHRLDVLDCNRDPELAPAIHDIYEAARYVLRSRKARALTLTAPPAIVVPAPSKTALSPAPVAPASPPSIALAPATPVVAPPHPIPVLAPRPPVVASQPPALVARPAQAPPALFAPQAPSHTVLRPALAPVAPSRITSQHAPAPLIADRAPASIAPATPLRIAPRFSPSLSQRPEAITNHLLVPAPAPRPLSVEESAAILAKFTWQPPRRVAAASEPAQDSEMFADVFASLGDPFDASAPAADRVARAQRVYRAYPPLPITFDEFFYGTALPTTPESLATSLTYVTSPTSSIASLTAPPAPSPSFTVAYLPPSSPVFASLPKPRPRPRLRPPATISHPALPPSLSSPPSLPTIHPVPVSFGELLSVAPGVRDLLRSFIDALEPAPRELRPLSHPRDAFDPGGVALALRSVPPTLSRLRCAHEAPRVVSFALCVAHPRYEPAPTCHVADPALRTRQSPPRALSRWSSATSRSMLALAPEPLASLSMPSLALAVVSRRPPDDLVLSCDTTATLRPSRSSPEQPANTPRDASATPSPTHPSSEQPATAPSRPATSRIANDASSRRVDCSAPRRSASPPAQHKTPPASSGALRVLEPRIACADVPEPARHALPPRDRDQPACDPPPTTSSRRDRASLVSAAPRNVLPVRSPLAAAALLASPAPRVDSAASCPASKVSPASGDTLRVLEPKIVCDEDRDPAQHPRSLRDMRAAKDDCRDLCDSGAPACHVSVALRHAPPPRSPFAILAAVLRLASSTAPAPRHESPSCSLPVARNVPRNAPFPRSPRTAIASVLHCFARVPPPPCSPRTAIALLIAVPLVAAIVPLALAASIAVSPRSVAVLGAIAFAAVVSPALLALFVRRVSAIQSGTAHAAPHSSALRPFVATALVSPAALVLALRIASRVLAHWLSCSSVHPASLSATSRQVRSRSQHSRLRLRARSCLASRPTRALALSQDVAASRRAPASRLRLHHRYRLCRVIANSPALRNHV